MEVATSGKEHYLEILVTDIVTDHVEKFGVKAQLVYLVGRAASKEVKYKSLNVTKQVEMKQAMGKEWSKWVQFSATKKLSKNDLQKLMTAHVHIRPVNTRWVLTLKDDEACKARLVVVGCQEPRGQIRSDSPTGSQLAFHITLWFATQKGWSLRCLDAATAFLQSKGIDRTLLLKMPADNPPPGIGPGEIVLATGSIYGTYDAGRTWYTYSKGIYASNRFRESPLEKSWYIYRNRHGVVTGVMHAHVDDILVACNTNDKETMAALESIRQKCI